MSSTNSQTKFLELIKEKLPPHVIFADKLAELLDVSRDSAYRRIRGQTSLSIDEAKHLSTLFQVSIDSLSQGGSDFLVFKHLIVNHTPKTFEDWLTSIQNNLAMLVNHSGEKSLAFTAKDIPIFHYFNYPHLCAFKMFFWMKSLLNYPDYQKLEYNFKSVPKKFTTMGSKIFDLYSQIPATEIWADETTNVTLKQLQFYQASGFFNSQDDIAAILDDYQALLTSIRDQTVFGKRTNGTPFELYKNEILIADNTVVFKMDEKRITFISHNITELLMTTDENFCRQTETFIRNLQHRSMLISTIGERERNSFFNEIERKVKIVRKQLLG